MRARLTEHFYEDEFACRCGRGELRLHPGFIEKLQEVRTGLGLPMHPTSGCRCLAYNVRVGGHERSLHVCDQAMHPGQQGTLGADFAAVDGAYRGKLFTVAWSAGLSIGWNAKRGFLHLDWRVAIGLPQQTFDY